MSMDNHSRGADTPITEQEGVMFGATPVWERNRKRRGFGRKASATTTATVSPEPRTFASDDAEPMALDRPVRRPDPTTTYALGAVAESPSMTAPMATTEPSDDGLVAPIGRSAGRGENSVRSRGMASTVIAAGAVGLVALGAAGWFASRDSEGVPELTPGGANSEVATAPALPVAAADPTLTAQNVLPERMTPPAAAAAEAPAPALRQMAQAERRTPSAARTRPAAASAETAGLDASGTAVIPGSPQPYSTLNAGATAPTTVNPAPAQTAPMPSTPPIITPEPMSAPAPQDVASPSTAAPQ